MVDMDRMTMKQSPLSNQEFSLPEPADLPPFLRDLLKRIDSEREVPTLESMGWWKDPVTDLWMRPV
jgi:hypothetical protein